MSGDIRPGDDLRPLRERIVALLVGASIAPLDMKGADIVAGIILDLVEAEGPRQPIFVIQTNPKVPTQNFVITHDGRVEYVGIIPLGLEPEP